MMYAITFDLDTSELENQYGSESWKNAYTDIRKTLISLGFEWTQGSVYFGNPQVTAVSCVLAVQNLGNIYPWFRGCVRDIRMLRIDELNDLRPALA